MQPEFESFSRSSPSPISLRVIYPDEQASEHGDQAEENSIVRPQEGAYVADPPLLPDETLLEELQFHNQLFEEAQPIDILRWGVQRFGSKLTMATAFGPEGMTLIHILAEISPTTRIVNIDTGYQFRETLELRERVRARYGIEVEFLRSELTVDEYERRNGGPVYKTDPNRCCAERKISVLRKAARGMHAWVSAIRRDQSPDRQSADIVGWDSKFHLVKINPLANWSKKDVWAMIMREDIPYNPLHDQGYPSIGCWPCTRSILAGEDERAGRWSGTAKTECGLHTKD